jgi:hypothetical protein
VSRLPLPLLLLLPLLLSCAARSGPALPPVESAAQGPEPRREPLAVVEGVKDLDHGDNGGGGDDGDELDQVTPPERVESLMLGDVRATFVHGLNECGEPARALILSELDDLISSCVAPFWDADRHRAEMNLEVYGGSRDWELMWFEVWDYEPEACEPDHPLAFRGAPTRCDKVDQLGACLDARIDGWQGEMDRCSFEANLRQLVGADAG